MATDRKNGAQCTQNHTSYKEVSVNRTEPQKHRNRAGRVGNKAENQKEAKQKRVNQQKIRTRAMGFCIRAPIPYQLPGERCNAPRIIQGGVCQHNRTTETLTLKQRREGTKQGRNQREPNKHDETHRKSRRALSGPDGFLYQHAHTVPAMTRVYPHTECDPLPYRSAYTSIYRSGRSVHL